jgi:hypothetical protein
MQAANDLESIQLLMNGSAMRIWKGQALVFMRTASWQIEQNPFAREFRI